MPDILKTWPVAVSARTTSRIFHQHRAPFAWCCFSLGRGKPHQKIDRMFFTYGGRILGWFKLEEILLYDGANLPKLNRLDGGESSWQFRPGTWVAICSTPCFRLRSRIAHPPFRGWRYFDLQKYAPDALVQSDIYALIHRGG
jgi:hypothetical protein